MQNDELKLSPQARKAILLALAEDIGSGDYTSLWSVPEEHRSVARIFARSGGVIAGIPVARFLLNRLKSECELVSAVPDGRVVQAGQVVAQLRGSTRRLLGLERTLLNFLQRLSGVATLTRRFVDRVEGSGAKILDTRKTTPGLRELEKYAVRVGGGYNHRFGLYDFVLLKENHIAAAGGIREAVKAVRKANDRNLLVEVEIRSVEEVLEASRAGVDRIMLDNMTAEQMRASVELIRNHRKGGHPEIEASGDINLNSVAEVAATGVDYISVGALTHSAGILNLTLIIETDS